MRLRNRTISAECSECRKKHGLSLQTKLKTNPVEEIYEREADRVADQVTEKSTDRSVSGAWPCIHHFSGPSNRNVSAVCSSIEQALAGPGMPLEPALGQDMERRFGHDFSKVRVHSDTAAEHSARDVNADAYTVGHQIVFAAGRFSPGTHAGRRLLAHELTHVVQQSGTSEQQVGPKELLSSTLIETDRPSSGFAVASKLNRITSASVQLKPANDSIALDYENDNTDPAVQEAKVYVDESTQERDRILVLIEELHKQTNDPHYADFYQTYLDRFNKWQQDLNFALDRTKKELLPEVIQENPESVDELNAEIKKLEELFKWKTEEWPVLQRQLIYPGATEKAEQSDGRTFSTGKNKAELAFHTVLQFNREFKEFSPISPPHENEQAVIWWRVWNPAWKTAPAHTNRFTLYNANRCGGCRHKEDQIMMKLIKGESIRATIEGGPYSYPNSVETVPLAAGNYEAYVELDIHGDVDEIDKTNNTAFIAFAIKPM